MPFPCSRMLLGLAALAITATQAPAQTPRTCGPRDQVLERLATGYGETRRSIGLGGNNHVIEVFASQETGSWTITVTNPDGITCLVAAGEAYEAITDTLPSGDGA